MNRFLSIVGILCLLAATLSSTGCFALPYMAKQAVCPDCGLRVCRDCKHAPDPGTAGYHCTTWVPMGDPCFPPPYSHPVEEAPVVTPAEQPVEDVDPERLPPVGFDAHGARLTGIDALYDGL
jgi:hypothetical protein